MGAINPTDNYCTVFLFSSRRVNIEKTYFIGNPQTQKAELQRKIQSKDLFNVQSTNILVRSKNQKMSK